NWPAPPPPRLFQSTPARERATRRSERPCWFRSVSIHARSRAGDLMTAANAGSPIGFNPRPLASGRQGTADTGGAGLEVSSHAARQADARRPHPSIPSARWSFNPRPLAGARRRWLAESLPPGHVSIHARSRAGDVELGVAADV